MRKPKTDPLLAALIAKLPETGTEWPIEHQQAWLRNMAMAFGLVYGGQVTFDPPAPAATACAAIPPQPKKPKHAFVIDMQGYVRRGNGERVLSKQVDAEIYDERGEADLKSIIWADDSRGLNGADLTIVGA